MFKFKVGDICLNKGGNIIRPWEIYVIFRIYGHAVDLIWLTKGRAPSWQRHSIGSFNGDELIGKMTGLELLVWRIHEG